MPQWLGVSHGAKIKASSQVWEGGDGGGGGVCQCVFILSQFPV